jgi:hypothetical protein
VSTVTFAALRRSATGESGNLIIAVLTFGPPVIGEIAVFSFLFFAPARIRLRSQDLVVDGRQAEDLVVASLVRGGPGVEGEPFRSVPS